MRDLATAVSLALDTELVAGSRLGGGDVADAYRFELADARRVFAKTHRSPPPGFFTTEATGLAWLREVGVLPVPEMLAVCDGDGDGTSGSAIALLVLEWVDEGDPIATTEAELGRALAALHRAGAPAFGRADRRTTGSRALPNEPCDTWVEFYAANRLEPLARLASDDGALDPPTLALLADATARLGELGGPPEPPARLHGDLWAGNRLVDAHGRSWLIDPAAHGGHREFDLAMMRLFGGFGAECFDAYHAAYPLAAGWEHRVALHQLAPLVVHAIKFGGNYAPAVRRSLERLLHR